ncbi:MAG: hypothetical protein Q8N63_01620 [Nanoarchaeota archaeon]|nr:hypothetical protein [Nanoarchaeota archaeon]
MKAIIKDVKLKSIFDLWERKPQGLSFADTDAIVLTINANGRTISETFYCRITANGTLATTGANKLSLRKQKTLQAFINKYISKEKNYNIRERNNEWKGKTIELIKCNGEDIIEL